MQHQISTTLPPARCFFNNICKKRRNFSFWKNWGVIVQQPPVNQHRFHAIRIETQPIRTSTCQVHARWISVLEIKLISHKEWTFLAAAKSLQSCPTLCDPTDGSPPGSPIPGVLQARTLEWVAISFSNAGKWKVKVKSLSHVWLFATPWTAAHQAPPSMGFSRQEYWSGVPLPSPLANERWVNICTGEWQGGFLVKVYLLLKKQNWMWSSPFF